jgi:hypothetical protein
LEGGFVLWVWDLAGEGELAAAPLPGRIGDQRIVVIAEVLERPLLTVLLTHEQKRDLRREEQAGRADPELVRGGPVL